MLGSARARNAGNGSGLLHCSAACGRRSWSPIQLQRWDQRVREGRAVAAGFGASQRDAGGEVGAQLISYNAGISACEKGRQWQRALSLLSEMWEVKLVPNIISLSAGVLACERSGHGQQAILMLTETRDAKLESFSDLLINAMRT
ncbi:unnamed protein product [Prorocentrum cordatum]|uniref:Pentatricopeptide repeat-containing protein n=1 Tax=Prorocentrum cordatum TaxID=2364126 RepID=A0ABN9UF50_9DINO|nr:unnamed protein product [Polarella glacialis]